TSWDAGSRPTATPLHRRPPSASSLGAWARRRMRFRRSQTSTRRGCSNCKYDSPFESVPRAVASASLSMRQLIESRSLPLAALTPRFTMNLLTVKGLSKQFGARAVLRDISFTVREGETLGLIGPNGAGKTTLFECLAGVIPADGGAVSFH